MLRADSGNINCNHELCSTAQRLPTVPGGNCVIGLESWFINMYTYRRSELYERIHWSTDDENAARSQADSVCKMCVGDPRSAIVYNTVVGSRLLALANSHGKRVPIQHAYSAWEKEHPDSMAHTNVWRMLYPYSTTSASRFGTKSIIDNNGTITMTRSIKLDTFLCAICMEIPVYQHSGEQHVIVCENSDYICSPCWAKVSDARCPACKTHNVAPDRTLFHHIAAYSRQCANTPCEYVHTSSSAMLEHAVDCAHSHIECPVCSKRMSSKEYGRHLTSNACRGSVMVEHVPSAGIGFIFKQVLTSYNTVISPKPHVYITYTGSALLIFPKYDDVKADAKTDAKTDVKADAKVDVKADAKVDAKAKAKAVTSKPPTIARDCTSDLSDVGDSHVDEKSTVSTMTVRTVVGINIALVYYGDPNEDHKIKEASIDFESVNSDTNSGVMSAIRRVRMKSIPIGEFKMDKCTSIPFDVVRGSRVTSTTANLAPSELHSMWYVMYNGKWITCKVKDYADDPDKPATVIAVNLTGNEIGGPFDISAPFNYGKIRPLAVKPVILEDL